MIQEIHDINNYSFNPVLESNEKLYDTPVTLFDKPWRIMDDFWMKHVHIKITDRCNAHCPFCIEKESHIKDDPIKLMANLKRLIAELDSQGHLATVSITGGEPSISPIAGDVVDFLKGNYKVFLNINTNFSKTIDSLLDPDWVNISRHKVGADDYTGFGALDLDMLDKYRAKHPSTKIRLQCVLHPHGLQRIQNGTAAHHHPGSAPVRVIIDMPEAPSGKAPDIHNLQVRDLSFDRSPDDRFLYKVPEHLRKDRQNRYLHIRSAAVS